MRGVIYARYSSIGQREESVEGQLRECKAFAERKGITLAGSYVDRAISGREAENRLEFDRAQERLQRNKCAPAAAKAKVDYLLTTKLRHFLINPNPSAHR